MKKVVTIVMLLTTVFMSVNVCYATVSENEIAEPRYVSVKYYNNSFDITENGMVCYELTLSPNPQRTPDKVTATVKIVNVDMGNNVYSKTLEMSYHSTIQKFIISDSKQLTSRGEYELRVTYKCYSGSTLLETITATPVTSSY